jgi:uncharacterized protein
VTVTVPEPATVEVTATGTSHAVPDLVLVGLAVEVRAAAVADALSAASTAVGRLIAAVDAHGIAAQDRRTGGLSVHEAWDRDRPGGHAAVYELQVVARDLDDAGRLVRDAAEQVGDALRLRSFALQVSDPAPAQERARRAAVAACRAHAEQLADAAGARLGALTRLTSSTAPSGPGPSPVRLAAALASAEAGLPAQAGQTEVVVAVTGVWELRA